MALFGIFRYYAISAEVGIHIEDSYAGVYDMRQVMLGFTVVGLCVGIVYGTVEYFFDKYVLRKITLGINILLQVIIVFVALIFISELVINISYRINGYQFPLEIGWWYKDRSFWPVLLYVAFTSFVFSLVVIVSEKFGKGIFFKLLIGKYKYPKEEQRIFMFVDLKSSTSIAEHLGHLKYSQLIQDCFYDLNELVDKYQAEIYQYVGDEAVISWNFQNGLNNRNCIELFFAFQKKLDDKHNFYMNKFGVTPQFKAGVHGGKIMVAEVGVIKKELAYHGDVVNTTSRIQGACNLYKVPLLISEMLLETMREQHSIVSHFFGDVKLKGKLKEIKIHGIIVQQQH
ncbi:hypothetical protein GCM10022396_22180 [Flavivirga amylovorans]